MELKSLDLQRRRKQLGLSQMQFAMAADISLPTLQNLESGKARNPSLDVIKKIASVLGLELTLSEPQPNWDYLAACGLPLLSQKHTSAPWDPIRLKLELIRAIQFLSNNSGHANARCQLAVLAFADALTSHYPSFVKNNGLGFLIQYTKKNKSQLPKIIKLRRLALAQIQRNI